MFQGVPYVEGNGMSSLYKLQVNTLHVIITMGSTEFNDKMPSVALKEKYLVPVEIGLTYVAEY